jgi:protein-arginine kinase activator protein McsA
VSKCERCGKEAELVIRTFVNFVPKSISICKKCLKETLLYDTTNYTKAGIELLAAHVDYIEETQSDSSIYHFKKNNLEIISLMPLAVQSVMFKQDELTKQRITKDLKSRKIYFLKQKLEKAVKNENYELAKHIKEILDSLDNLSEI